MYRRRSGRWFLVVSGVVLLAAGYVVGLPVVAGWLDFGREAGQRFTGSDSWLTEQLRVRPFEFLVFAWVFAFGSAIGSFLNVVIYRLPRGLSLLGSSRCPYCRCRIPARDNLPVVGWLVLAGRCRRCRLPIALRYPLVEAAVGTIFLVLASLELFHGGINLPGPDPGPGSVVSWLVGHVRWEFTVAWCYHSILASGLLSWALIQADGQRVPWRLTAGVALIGLAVPVLCPAVHPLRWNAGAGSAAVALAAYRLGTSVMGSVVGVGLGFLIAGLQAAVRVRRHGSGHRPPQEAAALGVVGLYLGWQATLSVAALAGAVWLAFVAATPRAVWAQRVPPSGAILAAVLVQLVGWRWLAERTWLPGTEPRYGAALIAVAVLVAVTVLAELLRAGRRSAVESS